ncbi:MAG: hypothetical protein FWF51_09990 [Chitinivibrionia bacterium]|nr:hypothetical protein [Chitinivibrionia bacterium]
MEEKKILTFEEIMAGFAETMKGFARIEKQQEENAKGFAELKELQKRNEEERKRNEEERKRNEEERKRNEEKNEEERKRNEEKNEEERKRNEEKSAKEWADLRESIKEMSKEIGGIGDSNGKFSETYFYNSLLNSMHFGGKDFDEIDKGLKRSKKLPNGDKLKGEYDVVMYNGNTIALIEVKYKVKKNHIVNLTTKQVKVFKELFPQYAKFDFYLGLAGLSFEDGIEKEALEQGIGILKPKGENVEIIDDNLKIY